ncbi:hypothetical protein RclHR1_05630001 [Rhizophagus clarus]|uniref:Uncharacterized protein n=1 Tax=Rhizophagus clarus TaxID=94130 RepID=A0A2Z6RPA8_9GLOM|nr:hypothetical protein RclHR1_05630001 [Rhizophagus clarus]
MPSLIVLSNHSTGNRQGCCFHQHLIPKYSSHKLPNDLHLTKPMKRQKYVEKIHTDQLIANIYIKIYLDYKIINDPQTFSKKTLRKQAARRLHKEKRLESIAIKAGIPKPLDDISRQQWTNKNFMFHHQLTDGLVSCYKLISHIMKSKHINHPDYVAFLPTKQQMKQRNNVIATREATNESSRTHYRTEEEWYAWNASARSF